MKKIKFGPLSILLLLTLSNCHKKTIPMQEVTIPQIIFGSGGGFAGLETEFCLLQDGKIIQKINKVDTVVNVVARIGKKKAAKCFDDCRSLKIETMKMNEPGNIYHFIVYNDGSKILNRVVWNAAEKPAIDGLEEMHKVLTGFLPKKE